MKVCVLYTGLPRTYKECFPNHQKSFISKYNVKDIYLSFWHNEKIIDEQYAPWSHNSMPSFKTTTKEILDCFNPKKYLFLNPPEVPNKEKLSYPYDFSKFTHEQVFNQCLAPIFSNSLTIYNGIKQIEEEYDYYILCRPDMLWSENLNNWPDLSGKDNYYFWDTLWILKPEIARIFANKIHYINDYANIIFKQNAQNEVQNYGSFITSEAINDLHFKVFGVDLSKFIPIKMKKQINRGNFIQS